MRVPIRQDNEGISVLYCCPIFMLFGIAYTVFFYVQVAPLYKTHPYFQGYLQGKKYFSVIIYLLKQYYHITYFKGKGTV